jgi:hypothetical protein
MKSDMKESAKSFKSVKRFTLVFVFIGVIEMIGLPILTNNITTIIIGLLTLIPAYLALNEKRVKLNYFVSIWAILRYNPITAGALTFLIIDATSGVHLDSSTHFRLNAIIYSYNGLAIPALIFGILLIIKTSKYIKQGKLKQ